MMSSAERPRSAVALTTAALPGVAALLTVAGCSDATGPVERLEAAAVRWEETGLEDYSFVYDQLCFCPYTGPYRVTVEGGLVTAIAPMPGSNSVGGLELDYFPTVDDLLDRLRDAAERDPVRFEVTYDADLGYPTSADVDISEQIVDEEYSFEVREFETS